MVLFAVINCEGKKVLERREVVREKSTVICLAYRANVKIMKRNSKARFLSSIKLLIVVNGIEIPRGDSTLLNTLAIMNGAKDLVIPFTEGLPVVKSIVKIKEPVPGGTKEEEFPDKNLPYGSVKGRASIEEEGINRLIVDVDRVLDDLREEESTHFMAHPWAKELDISSGIVPVFNREASDVGVTGLRDKGTSTDCPVTAGKSFVFLMAFVEDTCMSSVEFITSCIFNVF